jgi:ATP-dependent Clp protease ATP-binding subunit ClpA
VRRVITQKIEDEISEMIIEDRIKKNQKKIKITKKRNGGLKIG